MAGGIIGTAGSVAVAAGTGAIMAGSAIASLISPEFPVMDIDTAGPIVFGSIIAAFGSAGVSACAALANLTIEEICK